MSYLLWPFRVLWRFWVEPIRAEPVAAYRIAAGLVILWSTTCSLGPRMAVDLGPEGLTPAAMRGVEYDAKNLGTLDEWIKKEGRFCVLRGFIGVPFLDWWVDRESLGGFVPWCEEGGFWWFYALLVLALVFIVLGFLTRLSTLLALLLLVSFQARMSWVLNGGDAVMRDALFYLLLMPASAVWSVDAWLRGRIWGKKPGPVMIEPWSVRLAMIQLACIYFFTGLIKLSGAFDPQIWTDWWMEGKKLDQDWLNGEAVYWVLNDNALNRVPYYWLPIPMRICRVLSWGTLLFEIGFPLFVLSRYTRPSLLVVGVLFHLGIWFHTEVGFFSPIMLAWYPLFLSGETLTWLFNRKKKPGEDLSDLTLDPVPLDSRCASGGLDPDPV
jgi:hypothetical protein